MKARHLPYLLFAAVLAIGLITIGCSGKNKLLQEISGQWQDSQNHATVDIHLLGDSKTITVGDHSFPVSVEKVEMINYLVQLKVQNGSDKTDSWTLKEVWDENGASFKLSFNHDGQNELLISKAQS